MIKKIITSILVLLSIITIIPVACDTTEGEEKYEVTARMILPEELKAFDGQVSVIYEGEGTDIFLELKKSNDYTATQYVVAGDYSLFANIADGGFTEYSFWTKKSVRVEDKKVTIDVYVMSNSEYLNANSYEGSPEGLSECGEEYAKRQEQRMIEEAAVVNTTENTSTEVKQKEEVVNTQETEERVIQEDTTSITETEIETINTNVVLAACLIIVVILMLLLYLLLIRPKKINK